MILVGNAEAAERAEAGVDAVNGARLRGERFDEFAAALDLRPGFRCERAGKIQSGNLPGFGDGKMVAVERDHAD